MLLPSGVLVPSYFWTLQFIIIIVIVLCNHCLLLLLPYWPILFYKVSLYLFLGVLGLCCCMQAFSSCGKWVLFSSCNAWTSHCGGFPCYRARSLGAGASVGVASLWRRLSCSAARGIFMDRTHVPWIGRCVLTTGRPGKSYIFKFLYPFIWYFLCGFNFLLSEVPFLVVLSERTVNNKHATIFREKDVFTFYQLPNDNLTA